ncbi:MAG: hypothetical protein CMO61_13360 [Verrucomicrobiales bacterium]|nr:hypothetical protein [Verrucomicrobiales bacterium]
MQELNLVWFLDALLYLVFSAKDGFKLLKEATRQTAARELPHKQEYKFITRALRASLLLSPISPKLRNSGLSR